MASNSIGKIFRITTWGESHGKAIGVVIDGCPAGIPITEEEINAQLARRAPGSNAYVSPRVESDRAEVYSGLLEGVTTGAPISILIPNRNADSSKYESTKNLLRPGHANFTYLEKYGCFDHRGGGRASARETACRVAAGAIASKFLQRYGIQVIAYIKEIAGIVATVDSGNILKDQKKINESALFCPDSIATQKMIDKITEAQKQSDSVGGVVELVVGNLPTGLGDPVYEKLESALASALMSIPATKGFEMGSGFRAAQMQGSQHNDAFVKENDQVKTKTNHAGGTLGGISTGMPLIARVAFKPTSSIMQKQETVDLNGNEALLQHPEGSRHDPCVAIRAVPVVEAMAALVIADAILFNRCVRVE